MQGLRKYFYLLPTVLLGLSAFFKVLIYFQNPGRLPLPQLASLLLPLSMLELFCLVLFVLPRTANIGFFLLCSYLGGAIAVNLITGLSSPVVPAIILALFWISMFLKNRLLFLP
jgi:hypothetical protein